MVYRSPIWMSLCLALALAVPAFAQETSGSGVITEQGRPIVGAAVLVDGTETVLTDQDGRFTAPVSAGEHKFRVALNGYQPVERTVTAEMDKTVIIDFALEPVLQIQSLTVPASLKQGAGGQAQLVVKNNATTAYAIEAAGLSFAGADGKDRTADFTVTAAEANATEIKAGETVTLNFNVMPGAAAATGPVTVRANLFTFDTALGQNVLSNSSLEEGDDGASNWGFGIDNAALGIEAEGTIVTSPTFTGARSAEVRVPVSPEGDVRAYWTNAVAIQPNKSYVLSGYIKTENVESAAGFGASVYVPVTGNEPYQQPNSPWITGTKDWRKAIIAFQTTEEGDSPTAHVRGELQQATGVAWFDNISLTEGTADASLSVTGGDQTLEVTGA